MALDLLLTSRIVQADEMERMGLVTRVVPEAEVVPASVELAASLARSVSPASMATIKRQVLAQSPRGAHHAMAEADRLMVESLQGADVVEGVQSFLEKRDGEFAPLGHGTTFDWMHD